MDLNLRLIDARTTSGEITYASSTLVRDVFVRVVKDLLSMDDTPPELMWSDDEAQRRVFVASANNVSDEVVPSVAIFAVPYDIMPVGPHDTGYLDSEDNLVLSGVNIFKINIQVRAFKQDEAENIIQEIEKYLKMSIVRDQISAVGIDIDMSKPFTVSHQNSLFKQTGTKQWISILNLVANFQWEYQATEEAEIDAGEVVTPSFL